jgi:hypothetical protein
MPVEDQKYVVVVMTTYVVDRAGNEQHACNLAFSDSVYAKSVVRSIKSTTQAHPIDNSEAKIVNLSFKRQIIV